MSHDGLAPMDLDSDNDDSSNNHEEGKSQHRPHHVTKKHGVKREREEEEEQELEETKGQEIEDEQEPTADEADEADADQNDGENDINDDASVPYDPENADEVADRKRAKQLARQAKVRSQLKNYNEALDRPEVHSVFLKQQNTGLRNAALKLDSIAENIGEKDVSNSVLDALGYKKLGAFGARQAHTLSASTKIDVDDLVTGLQNRFGGFNGDATAIDWTRLGRDVSSQYFRTVDLSTSFMRGLIGLASRGAQKEKRTVTRKKKFDDEDKDEPMTQAEQLLDTSKEAQSMTDKRVTLLFHHLPSEPTNFFKVLIHPGSFTQTIENLFDLTFLIRKGQAEVAIDEELQIPMVRRVGEQELIADEDDAEGGAKSDTTSYQCIWKMDIETYERILHAFKLEGLPPFLPDRTGQYTDARKQRSSRVSAPTIASAESEDNIAAASSSAAAAAASASPSRRRPRSSTFATGVTGDISPSRLSALEKLPAYASASQPTLRGFAAITPTAKKQRRSAAAASSASRHNEEESDAEEQPGQEEEEEG